MSRTYKHEPNVHKRRSRQQTERHYRRVVKHHIKNGNVEKIPSLQTVSNKLDAKNSKMQAARYFEQALPWGWWENE